MSSEHKDEMIRRLFREQRLRDEKSTPPFEAILAAKEERTRTWVGQILLKQSRLAIAASLLLVIGIPLVLYLDRETQSETIQTSLEIMDWESPTDFLLSYSDSTALEMGPTLELDFPAWAEENTLHERD